jgi:membrane-associated phospholipid phosphatase
MKFGRLGGLVVRRLSREEFLGLHLTIGLVLSLCLVVAFGLIARGVERPEHLAHVDTSLGEELATSRAESPNLRYAFLLITQLGSFPAMSGLALFGALTLLLLRRRLLALVWVVAPAGAGLLGAALKLAFERPRPPFGDPAIHESTLSFPSGHSMGSVVGYGLLAYVTVLALARPWQGILAAFALGLLVLLIGFSRIYLGAHYLSDVLGGLTVGGFWVGVCITGLEIVRRRSRIAPAASTAQSAAGLSSSGETR